MAATTENADRRMVPRWRTFRDALTAGELGSSERLKTQKIEGAIFFEEKLQQWRSNRELPFAVDLVGASHVLGGTDQIRDAAEFILESQASSLAAQRIARAALGIREDEPPSPSAGSREEYFQQVQKLKARRIEQKRNAFVWTDLARLYVVLGQRDAAQRTMKVALALAPTNRFVLRCATRLLLHSCKREEALRLLRANPRTLFDPWLLAAETAVSSVNEKAPKFFKQSQQALANRNILPFHKSELAAALGSVEMFDGNNRKANKMFINALAAPTDNVLAQVVWASRRTGLGEIDAQLLQMPKASEANAFDADNHAQWADVVGHALTWANDEAFSSRPRLLASATAASLLDRPELGEQIAKDGLSTDPTNPGLINNAAFAMIMQGKVTDAVLLLNKASKREFGSQDMICLLATTGLAYYRSGNAIEGRRHYELAIDAATRAHANLLRVRAKLYLGRELVLQGDPEGLAAFREAAEEAQKFKNTNLPHLAKHLEKNVIDALLKGTEAAK
jgi:tetratricopeptide (TPR) repeat protein